MMVQPKLWQPKQPVFWLGLVLCLFGGAVGIFEIVVMLSRTSAPAAAAAILLFAAQAVILWLILRLLARFKRQPLSMQVAALIWSLTAIPGLAMLANTPYSEPLRGFGLHVFQASLSAPINEDAFRLLGVFIVLILAYGMRMTAMDGVIYGFIVGAGFEIFENLLYALRGEDFAAVLNSGLARMLLGFGLHALWTTVAAAALAYCLSRHQAGLGGRWWIMIPGAALPMALHAAWDAPEISVLPVVAYLVWILLYVLTVSAFLFALRWARRSEFAWFVAGGGEPSDYRTFARLPRPQRHELASAAVARELASSN